MADEQDPLTVARGLAILKMMFFRRKDLADVEVLVQAQRASLDLPAVHEQLVDLMVMTTSGCSNGTASWRASPVEILEQLTRLRQLSVF